MGIFYMFIGLSWVGLCRVVLFWAASVRSMCVVLAVGIAILPLCFFEVVPRSYCYGHGGVVLATSCCDCSFWLFLFVVLVVGLPFLPF